MRRSLWLLAWAAVLAAGCSGPIPTREITFYREKDVNGGKPIQVDIIYPQNDVERGKLWDMKPEEWFGTSDLFDKVPKEEFDIRSCTSVNDCSSLKRLDKKTKPQPWMVIIAELGKRPEGSAPTLGQKQIITYEKSDKPKKREYIRIHQGYIERLDKKPRD